MALLFSIMAENVESAKLFSKFSTQLRKWRAFATGQKLVPKFVRQYVFYMYGNMSWWIPQSKRKEIFVLVG